MCLEPKHRGTTPQGPSYGSLRRIRAFNPKSFLWTVEFDKPNDESYMGQWPAMVVVGKDLHIFLQLALQPEP